MSEIVVVAAVAENRVIGDGLKLPWHIPRDLQHFKRLTLGQPLIMGRRTFQSLVEQFGGPLPERRNLILTSWPEEVREMADGNESVQPFASIEEALAAASESKITIIAGGAAVYEIVLDTANGPPLADRLELTRILAPYDGDTFFPPFEHLLGTVYQLTRAASYPAERDQPALRFETWERKPSA